MLTVLRVREDAAHRTGVNERRTVSTVSTSSTFSTSTSSTSTFSTFSTSTSSTHPHPWHLQHPQTIFSFFPVRIASLAAIVQLAEWDARVGPQLSGVLARIADAKALIS